MTLTIPDELPDLNTYIRVERGNRYAAAKLKKDATQTVAWIAKRLPKVTRPVRLEITWHCKNRRKDPDNISFGVKFILDGLMEAGVLENDGWGQIRAISHSFEVDAKNPRIEVVLC